MQPCAPSLMTVWLECTRCRNLIRLSSTTSSVHCIWLVCLSGRRVALRPLSVSSPRGACCKRVARRCEALRGAAALRSVALIPLGSAAQSDRHSQHCVAFLISTHTCAARRHEHVLAHVLMHIITSILICIRVHVCRLMWTHGPGRFGRRLEETIRAAAAVGWNAHSLGMRANSRCARFAIKRL